MFDNIDGGLLLTVALVGGALLFVFVMRSRGPDAEQSQPTAAEPSATDTATRQSGPRYTEDGRRRELQRNVERWTASGWELEVQGDTWATLTAAMPDAKMARVRLVTDEWGYTDYWRTEGPIERMRETRPIGPGGPPTVVRVYHGSQQADAVAAFRRDAENLSLEGYHPVSQSWAAGQWGCGAFVIAIVLMIVLVGFLIFLYLLIVKPEGTLTVTYARAATLIESQAPPVSTPAQAEPQVASAPLAARLAELSAAHDAGHLTDEEYAAKRAEILERF
jgi:hypothetical protein